MSKPPASVWRHFGRWDKTITVPITQKKKKRRLSNQTSGGTIIKTISDPEHRKCNHCGERIHRKLHYAVEHINICSQYKGNKYDSDGEEITDKTKQDSESKSKSNTNKTNSISTSISNKNKSKCDSSGSDTDSDAYYEPQQRQQSSILNYTVKTASKQEQETMNQWLANGIATAGSISYNAISTNKWFGKIFERCGFKIQCWDAIKKKIIVYEQELKTKTDEYLTKNVETATIGFDGSSDQCKAPLTAYGAFVPQSLLLEIRRPPPGKQTSEKCFEELQDVASKTESKTGTTFTKAVNDSCEQQTKVRKLWERNTPWIAYGCGGHTMHNGSKYIWNIPFFSNCMGEFTLVYGIKNTKAIQWVDPLILRKRLFLRAQLSHIKQEKKQKLIKNNNNSNSNGGDSNNDKEIDKIDSITIEQIKRNEIEYSDILKTLFESKKFQDLIDSKLKNSKERVGWFDAGKTRVWNEMVHLCEHLLSIKEELLEA